MATLKKLDMFWKHSECPRKFKLLVQDAVIRAKLFYGLESAEQTETEQRKLDTFQLKGLRKILQQGEPWNPKTIIFRTISHHVRIHAGARTHKYMTTQTHMTHLLRSRRLQGHMALHAHEALSIPL